jgi:hypothetical protein
MSPNLHPHFVGYSDGTERDTVTIKPDQTVVRQYVAHLPHFFNSLLQ